MQDQVELALMRSEHHKVARAYVLYREERARQRAEQEAAKAATPAASRRCTSRWRRRHAACRSTSRASTLIVDEACAGLDGVDAAAVLAETQRNLYDGISADELALAPIMAARTLVEQRAELRLCQRPAAARQAAHAKRCRFVHRRADQATQAEMAERYAEYFPAYIKTGIEAELLDPGTGALRPRRGSPRR